MAIHTPPTPPDPAAYRPPPPMGQPTTDAERALLDAAPRPPAIPGAVAVTPSEEFGVRHGRLTRRARTVINRGHDRHDRKALGLSPRQLRKRKREAKRRARGGD